MKHLDSERLQRLGAGESLPDDTEREARAHLDDCPECRERVASWQRLCAGLSTLESPDPGPEFTAAVLAGLDAPAPAPALALKGWALGIVAASLAAGLLAVFGADLLADFPALVARGIGAFGATVAAALAVLDGLGSSIPEGTGVGLLVVEALLFVALSRVLLKFAPLPQVEESLR